MAHFEQLPEHTKEMLRARGLEADPLLEEWLAAIKDSSFDVRRLMAVIRGPSRGGRVPSVIPLAFVIPSEPRKPR